MNLNDCQVLIDDLSHYTGLSKAEVERRMGETQAVPNQWRAEYGHGERSPEDYHRFYTFNWLYLFDLANFASQFRADLAHSDKYMKGRCLDYGCGIGTVAVHLATMDSVTEVHATDVCIITADFLRFRKNKHNLHKLTVLDPTSNTLQTRAAHILPSSYDFIYARDVLEHCWDRVNIVSSLCDNINSGGCLAEATPIQHIGPNDGYENVRQKPYDLWDVLRDKQFERVESEWTGGFSLGHTNIWRKP